MNDNDDNNDNDNTNDNTVGIEAFCKKKEKNLLNNLFREESDSSVSSYSDDDDDDDDNDNNNELINNNNNNNNNNDDDDNDNDNDIFNAISIIINENIKKDIYLKQQRVRGIAHQLWPASIYLCNYIFDNKNTTNLPITNTNDIKFNVLEIGAGLGLCGIYCHYLLKDQINMTIVTDLDEAIDNINYNINLNECETNNIISDVLCWGNSNDLNNVMSKFNLSLPILVLAADCVYWETLYNPLYETICSLVIDYDAIVLMSYVKRWKKCEKFFKLFQKIKEIKINIMKESVEWVKDENTNKKCKRITRLYSFAKNK